MTDLWDGASAGHEDMVREAALARADAEMEQDVMPFLLAAGSVPEFGHRLALAAGQIGVIAAMCDVDAGELAGTARRRYELYRQALAEGDNVLQEIETISDHNSNGSGPEKPDGHSTGPDFAGDYAEVPQGAPQGPDPQVTQVRPPQMGPVSEATGSLRRQAGADPGSMMMPSSPSAAAPAPSPMPSSSMGAPANLPAGVSGSGAQAPGGPDTTPAPDVATTQGLGNFSNVTSSRDPVRRKVLAVTAAVAATNPQLPAAECERVARVVVGRYFRQADLTDSVMSNGPVESGGSGGDGSGGGGGMSGLEQYGLGKSLINKLPGGGGMGLIGDAGELAAL
jgi:hypothetical protein